MKSVTEPSRARSIRLPIAPPSSSPVGSHTSGRSVWVAKKNTSASSASAVPTTSTAPPSARKPNAMPELRTLTRSTPASRSRRSPSVMPSRTSALVSWSSATTPAATAAAASVVRRGAHPGRMSSTTMPPTTCRTMIATIGLRSSGPIRSGRRRNRFKPRVRRVAQEVQHGVEPARVRHPHAHREDEREHDPRDDHDHVDGQQRGEEVRDLGPGGGGEDRHGVHHVVHRLRECGAHAAALERREPAGGGPAGRRDRAAQRERVVRARPQQLGRAGHRLGDELRGELRRHAAADRGIHLRLDEQRPVGRPDAAGGPGDAHQRLGDVDDGAETAEQLPDAGAQLLVHRRVGYREREHAAPDLHGRVRLDPEDRRVRVRGADLGLLRAARGSTRPPWRRRRSRVATAPSCAGLWASTTRSARSASSRFEPTASPPTSAASSRARPEPESVHSTGSAQPTASARAILPDPTRPIT